MRGYEATAAIHEAGEYIKEMLDRYVRIRGGGTIVADLKELLDILGVEVAEEGDEEP